MRSALPSTRRLASRRAPPLAALALLAAALAGCSQDHTPVSVVDDLRVLALPTEPPEVGPGQAVTVTAALAVPDPVAPRPLTETWTFCPFTTGAAGGFACAIPACEVALAPVAGAVTFKPSDEVQRCIDLLGGSLPTDPAGAGVPASVETVLRYQASDGVTTRVAVQRIPLDTQGVPAAPNHAPAVPQVTLDGATATPCADPASCAAAATWARGRSLLVGASVDAASIESYVDGAGRTVQETVVLSFYTTAGRFKDDRGQAPATSSELQDEQIPAGTTTAWLWVTALDLRGGASVAGPFKVALGP